MKKKNSFNTLITALLLFFILTSAPAYSQHSQNLTIYESVDQMVAAAKEVITEIPAAEFKTILETENPLIIDVRTSAEYEAGAIPNAVNIPRGVLEFRIGDEELWNEAKKSMPAKSDTFFVYCGTGSRGALSAKALMQLSYKNVQSIKGGWNTWHEKYPEITR